LDISSVSISNFRSITEEIEIPLSGPITFLVGPNNSGKSNMLRCLALIFNRAFEELNYTLDFDAQQEKILKFKVRFRKSILNSLSNQRELLAAFVSSVGDDACFSVNVAATRNNVLSSFDSDIFDILPQIYFEKPSDFSKDFHQSGSRDDNLGILFGNLNPLQKLLGTVYVPSIRLVTTDGNAIPHFGRTTFPGENLLPETIVKELAGIANPSGDWSTRKAARDRLNGICTFMSYCIEEPNVVIRVPHDTTTIYVEIDGVEPNEFNPKYKNSIVIVGFQRDAKSKIMCLKALLKIWQNHQRA
jgi:energy-coupling factor transporter ATP-binding protein EcfA2